MRPGISGDGQDFPPIDREKIDTISTAFPGLPTSIEVTAVRSILEKWAHQDSNLERAGYEPAALTVELWARPRYYCMNRRASRLTPRASRLAPRASRFDMIVFISLQ